VQPAHHAEDLDDERSAFIGFLIGHLRTDAATASSPGKGRTPCRQRKTWLKASWLRPAIVLLRVGEVSPVGADQTLLDGVERTSSSVAK